MPVPAEIGISYLFRWAFGFGRKAKTPFGRTLVTTRRAIHWALHGEVTKTGEFRNFEYSCENPRYIRRLKIQRSKDVGVF